GAGVGIGARSIDRGGPKDKPQARADGARHLKSLLCFRAACDFLPPSCFSPTSPPASASRCPARPARPTPSCSPASPRRSAPAPTALVRLAPPAFMAGYTFHFTTKQRLDEAALKAQLTLAGYTHVSQVVSPGEYAVRGGLIDLFPMGSAVPYRVDLFGDEID